MTQRESLLKAICQDPEDDTVRLAFADLLDEEGEPRRATFIRLQIELAQHASLGVGWSHLKLKHRRDDRISDFVASEPWERFTDITYRTPTNLWAANSGPTGCLFHRGFPTAICCTLMEFCHNWNALGRYPITHVAIQSRTTHGKIGVAGWPDGDWYVVRGTGKGVFLHHPHTAPVVESILEHNYPCRFTRSSNLNWRLWPVGKDDFGPPIDPFLLLDMPGVEHGDQ